MTNKGWQSGDDAITSNINLEKLLGADRAGRTVVLPKDEKDAEGIKAFRAKLGVPEKAEGYELPVPEGQEVEFAKVASGWFHELGIPKEAAQKLTGKWNEYINKLVTDSDAAIKAASDKDLATIKGEWGADFDKNAEFARRFMREAGWSDEKIKRYEEAFGTADMLKTFHGLGSKLGEHKGIPGDGKGGGSMSSQQAKEAIEKLKADRIAGTVDEKAYQEKIAQLGPLAYPG